MEKIIFESFKQNNSRIFLKYITQNGDAWLDEDVYINDDNYKEVIDAFVKRNEKNVKKLEDKWKRNGEDVFLTLDFSPVFVDKQLQGKIFKYIQDM